MESLLLNILDKLNIIISRTILVVALHAVQKWQRAGLCYPRTPFIFVSVSLKYLYM